jgi:amino acid transporter
MSAAPSNYDPEKNLNLQDSNGNNSPNRNDWAPGQDEPKRAWTTRFVDSFKRDPNAHVLKPTQETANPRNRRDFDHLAAAERTANSGLATKLKGRHLQMIAIGGSIGSSRNLT